VLADALGSVGVIVSSVLVKFYGFQMADPICSALISVLIFASVVPLIKSSSETLIKSPSLKESSNPSTHSHHHHKHEEIAQE